MSLSNPQIKNPATRFMQWRGGADGGGRITYYDKADEQEYEVDLPFRFTVLDELHTITGFSEKDHSGFWSNEVRDLKDKLVVRTKAGVVAQGAYGDISDGIKSKGAKYAKSVYIAFKDESGELVIGNIKFSGASLTAWIEFQKKFDVSVAAVTIEGGKKAKKGATVYFTPIIDGLNLNAQTKKEAVKLDEELQRYLNTYMAQKPKADDNEIVDEDEDDDEDIHNIKGVDDKPAADDDDSEEEDDEDEPAAPAPKKKVATKKKADVNIQDVEF